MTEMSLLPMWPLWVALGIVAFGVAVLIGRWLDLIEDRAETIIEGKEADDDSSTDEG